MSRRRMTYVDMLTPSYLVTIDDDVIYFELSNTPISNFATIGNSGNPIIVNGQSVIKYTIKEIYFGGSYKDVTSLVSHFLAYCSNLTSVDFSGLSNVTSIGNVFLGGCGSLTSVNLSSNITSIGNYFLYDCSILTTLKMGAETPPTLQSNAFFGANSLSLIQVPCGSELSYKSATGWNAKAGIIQGDC